MQPGAPAQFIDDRLPDAKQLPLLELRDNGKCKIFIRLGMADWREQQERNENCPRTIKACIQM
jgi:hypothetical protein